MKSDSCLAWESCRSLPSLPGFLMEPRDFVKRCDDDQARRVEIAAACHRYKSCFNYLAEIRGVPSGKGLIFDLILAPIGEGLFYYVTCGIVFVGHERFRLFSWRIDH